METRNKKGKKDYSYISNFANLPSSFEIICKSNKRASLEDMLVQNYDRTTKLINNRGRVKSY